MSADYNNNSIRMIAADGTVTTIAGGANGPTDPNIGYVLGFLDGPGATAPLQCAILPRFRSRIGKSVRRGYNNSAIRMISLPDYTVTTIAGGGGTFGASGFGTAGFKDGAGGAALFMYPFGIRVDKSGNLYVADTENHAIRKIAASTYAVTTIAGGGGANATNTPGLSGYANGAAATALFVNPLLLRSMQMAIFSLPTSTNRVIREISGGTVSLFAGTAPTGTASSPVPVIGNTDGAPGVATFGNPNDLIVDSSGNLYVADFGNAEIRKVDCQRQRNNVRQGPAQLSRRAEQHLLRLRSG